MAYSLMFYDVEVHVCIKHMCVCVCVCVCADSPFQCICYRKTHFFITVCVCILGNTNVPYLHDTDSLNILSSYIYIYVLITTFRVYTYILSITQY
jgi:hypothetical protein